MQSDPYSIYSFLLVAGYLKVSKIYPQNDGNYMCEVAISNKEIAFVYEKEVLDKTGRTSMAIAIQQAIFIGDAENCKICWKASYSIPSRFSTEQTKVSIME